MSHGMTPGEAFRELIVMNPSLDCDLWFESVQDDSDAGGFAATVECRNRGWLHRIRHHRRRK